jgi:hypothetical protein
MMSSDEYRSFLDKVFADREKRSEAAGEATAEADVGWRLSFPFWFGRSAANPEFPAEECESK